MANNQKAKKLSPKILLADDDPVFRMMFHKLLEKNGFDVALAENGEEAIEKMTDEYSLAILDLDMPELSGVECLKQIRARFPFCETFIVSGVGQIQDAVQAMKDGAFEFITKPCVPDQFLNHVKRAIRTADLSRKNQQLQKLVEQPRSSSQTFIGESHQSQILLERISKLAHLDSTVLITGESGTGKTTIARRIHDQGSRAEAPFVAVNCASLPRELIESELFGHVKGAFTGATEDRPGRAEVAMGGTLFLDEIGDMPLELQPKLLTFLQEKTIQRIGSNKSIKVDVRLIAATHQDLLKMGQERRFRMDLYYRLNVLDFHVLSLRERPEDIPVLAKSIIDRIVRRQGGEEKNFTPDALSKMMEHHWPGNIRELENVLERASAFCDSHLIDADDLAIVASAKPSRAETISNGSTFAGMTLKEIEKQALIDSLKANNGNRAMTARQLGISEKSIYNKLRKFDLFDNKKN